MTHITTGAPNTGVMALSGMSPPDDGMEAMRLQSKAMRAPVSMVTGISMP